MVFVFVVMERMLATSSATSRVDTLIYVPNSINKVGRTNYDLKLQPPFLCSGYRHRERIQEALSCTPLR